MGGFNTIRGDEAIVFADNASFDGTERGGKLTTNGQLWIGSTASPHVKKGVISSPDSSITINYSSPNITIETNGSMIGETITGDSGGALSPILGNWNILGQDAGTTPVMETTGSGNTLTIEDRTWLTQLVVDASTTVGTRGTYSTIASALTDAISGQTIFIRSGTYTENLTLKSGVNLASFVGNQQTPNVTIIGKITASYSGSASISGIRLQTNADFCIVQSGVSACLLYLNNCYINATNNSAISLTNSNASSLFDISYSFGNLGTTGIKLFDSTTIGTILPYWCRFTNTGASLTSSTFTAGAFQTKSCLYESGFTFSSNGGCDFNNSQIFVDALGITCLTINSTGGGGNNLFHTRLDSGTATSLVIGAGATCTISHVTIFNSNANAISGAGTLRYAHVDFIGTSSVIGSTIQVPNVSSNDAVTIKTPGAYPYTTIPQDNLILVDTSSARSIVPLASPTTGQVHRIKDNVGSAAANNITITPSGKNIDGAASYVINTNYGSVDIIYNGTQWNIL